MPTYKFTLTELTENTVFVSVSAATEDAAKAEALGGSFITHEQHETTGVRAYEIQSFDGMDDD